jgi:hypothetical protein
MSAPFFKFDLFGPELSLLVAFVVGIGFGFFLERAGFGSARKLTAQFYLTDLAVFKVMFTAIVTAMLGLFYLGWLGWLDLSLVYVSPTYLAPQLLGGLLLGLGFIVGGYCPGTSIVAIVSGRLDGLVFGFGVLAGIFAFGQSYPRLEGFLTSTDLGAVTWPQLLSLPYGLVVFAVVVMALLGFLASEAVERRFGAGESEPQG